ncbi:MAG TPA: hypothetical protein VL737_01470, partial [Candidatus Pristimantibacillus sp.]|nr:hypothetical protein [Candidatus Pristimantibacillus sp.]
RWCSDEQQQRLIDMVQELAQDPSSRKLAAAITEGLIDYSAVHSLRGSRPTQVINQGLAAAYGMDFVALRPAWEDGHDPKKNPNYHRDNIEMILDLESRNPGISKALRDRFKISNFARCPVEIWEDMYANIDNKDMPYGAVMYAEADYNSAFVSVKDKIGDLYKQLKSMGCLLRVYECASVADVEGAIMQAENVYERQLEFGLMVAHGTPKGFRLANRTQGLSCEFLDAADVFFHIASGRLQKLASQFVDDALLALYSCSTGDKLKKACLGQVLAEALGMLVLAPNVDVAMTKIKASKDKQTGRIRLALSFKQPDAVMNLFDGRPSDWLRDYLAGAWTS